MSLSLYYVRFRATRDLVNMIFKVAMLGFIRLLFILGFVRLLFPIFKIRARATYSICVPRLNIFQIQIIRPITTYLKRFTHHCTTRPLANSCTAGTRTIIRTT